MNGQPWTPRELTYLRRYAGKRSHATIAHSLGRSVSSIQSKARDMGCTSREFWSDEELSTLAAMYKTHAAPAIARVLGRSVKSVYWAIYHNRLKKMEWTRTDAHFRDELARLVGEGHTDTEIGAILSRERHTISKHRKAMGLPGNARGPRFRARVAETTRRQCVNAGVPSLGAVRALAYRRFAEDRGWPSELPPRAVMILDALEAHGPMTREQITQAIGMPWKGSHHSLAANGPGGSYTALLMRCGLVVRLGRLVKGRGKGHSVNLYGLALTATRREPRRTPSEPAGGK